MATNYNDIMTYSDKEKVAWYNRQEHGCIYLSQ